MPRKVFAFSTAFVVACCTPWAKDFAAPLQDTSNIVTVQVENDAVSAFRGTSDQYYTSGRRVGWTSRPPPGRHAV